MTVTQQQPLVLPSCDPTTPLGLYVHVPFCATRCGYCDFNTYTAGELGADSSPEQWHVALDVELAIAADRLAPVRPVSTVFVGGGTPSLLGADGLAGVLDVVRRYFDLTADVEITTESNPESTSPEFFEGLLAAGFTRVSLGMQSAAPHVLATLDRTHTPGRAVAAAQEATAAGFGHVNLDLIYGTPGESDDDLARTLDAVLAAGVDHVSAYALIVEDGTALARRVRRGELPAPDDDVLADRYEMIDERLTAAGLDWYEVSNWARAGDLTAQCRHNLAYWDSSDWWGAGPGAHSHVAGVRWSNVKHPGRYAVSLRDGELPVAMVEELTPADQHTERVMLGLRRSVGLPLSELDSDERVQAVATTDAGLTVLRDDRVVLSNRGRLLADGVIRQLLVD
ncbi:radical SAM family heme chaperone HemW [Williamsia sp.]|uniref:radical SAM family heme chaperone HemW n=1 Tax=Williamsia sp. TaxID=1872085 RepID=UPI0025F41389|nr:radical SAM family heme chaperone HemW [Williamsia sp.]